MNSIKKQRQNAQMLNNKMKLFYRNRDCWEDTSNYVSQVAKELSLELLMHKKAVKPDGCALWLIHNPDSLTALSECDWEPSGKYSPVILAFFMSSQGKLILPQPPIVANDKAGKPHKVYIFGIREDGSKLSTEKLSALLAWGRKMVEKLSSCDIPINKIKEEMPPNIGEMLIDSRWVPIGDLSASRDNISNNCTEKNGYLVDPETLLPSFLILCQGYFLAHLDELSEDDKKIFKLIDELSFQTNKYRLYTESGAYWADVLGNKEQQSLLIPEIQKANVVGLVELFEEFANSPNKKCDAVVAVYNKLSVR